MWPWDEMGIRTWDSTASTTSTEMIDNGGITFDSSVDGQVGTISSVGDFFVFEDSERGLNRFGSRGAGLEELHAHLGRSGERSQPRGVVHY